MVNSLTPPGLEGLFDLDRQGVDIRPTLLRVLTDQFLRSPTHTRDDEQRYTELALRLIDETDIATRAAVATRLAPHAFAPRPVILQLARDVLEVAEPVLLKSPVLTPADCQAIIEERGVCYADILARRTNAATSGRPASPKAHAFPAPSPSSTQRSPMQPAASPASESVLPPIQKPGEVAATLKPEAQFIPWAEASELCELFFAADAVERRLILLNLDYSPWPAEPAPVPLQRVDIWRLETAALRHNSAAVVRELERALDISLRQAHRIVEDDLGDPIVAAGKAIALPADVLQRILLFLNPGVGQSVDRVYELAALYSDISVQAARRLVAIVRAAEAVERPAAPDTRALHTMLEIARGSSAQTANTAGKQTETPRLHRALFGGR